MGLQIYRLLRSGTRDCNSNKLTALSRKWLSVNFNYIDLITLTARNSNHIIIIRRYRVFGTATKATWEILRMSIMNQSLGLIFSVVVVAKGISILPTPLYTKE